MVAFLRLLVAEHVGDVPLDDGSDEFVAMSNVRIKSRQALQHASEQFLFEGLAVLQSESSATDQLVDLALDNATDETIFTGIKTGLRHD